MVPADVVDLLRRRSQVLVVEDEFLIRSMVVEELRTAGYQVFEAANCSEALAVLATHRRIAVLFTDINMPGSMNGDYLIRVVRAEFPHIVVIAATSASTTALVEGLLSKPYEPSDAVAMVDKLLPRQAWERT